MMARDALQDGLHSYLRLTVSLQCLRLGIEFRDKFVS